MRKFVMEIAVAALTYMNKCAIRFNSQVFIFALFDWHILYLLLSRDNENEKPFCEHSQLLCKHKWVHFIYTGIFDTLASVLHGLLDPLNSDSPWWRRNWNTFFYFHLMLRMRKSCECTNENRRKYGQVPICYSYVFKVPWTDLPTVPHWN